MDMEHFDYRPRGVCPMKISFDLDGDTVHNVSFLGGCNGNLQAISRVVEGMTVEQIEGYFKGEWIVFDFAKVTFVTPLSIILVVTASSFWCNR